MKVEQSKVERAKYLPLMRITEKSDEYLPSEEIQAPDNENAQAKNERANEEEE